MNAYKNILCSTTNLCGYHKGFHRNGKLEYFCMRDFHKYIKATQSYCLSYALMIFLCLKKPVVSGSPSFKFRKPTTSHINTS